MSTKDNQIAYNLSGRLPCTHIFLTKEIVISIELEWERAGREREILNALYYNKSLGMQIAQDFSSPHSRNPSQVRSK